MFPRKYRIHAFLALMALVIIFYPSYRRKPDQQRIDTSSAAAVAFLQQVDDGQYAQSWEACSAYLKKDIPQQEWVERLSAVRAATGKLLDRKQKNYIYTKEPKEGIPEGEYLVYVFSSKFTDKDELTETVTLMLEKDNAWRVAGYFIE